MEVFRPLVVRIYNCSFKRKSLTIAPGFLTRRDISDTPKHGLPKHRPFPGPIKKKKDAPIVMDYLGDMSRPIKEELILQVFHFQKQIQHCQILEIHVYYT